MIDRESYSPTQTQSLNTAFRHISTLLADLEEKDADAEDVNINALHANIDNLINKVSDRQFDLLGDLTSIIESFRDGHMTPHQLESMIIAEQKRSAFILRLSGHIGTHMTQMFDIFSSIIEHLENGDELPNNFMKTMSQKMAWMFDQVESITRVISVPAHALQSTIGEIEIDIDEASKTSEENNDLISLMSQISKQDINRTPSHLRPSGISTRHSPSMKSVSPVISPFGQGSSRASRQLASSTTNTIGSSPSAAVGTASQEIVAKRSTSPTSGSAEKLLESE
jgi:hypothetical protein